MWVFFFSSRRRHTRFDCDWSSDVCSSDLVQLELQALLRQAGGATDEAVRLMREAAVLEDRMPAEFGPPPDVKPAHELFGEMLLGAGRAAEAQREFARALALAPKRALSLLGLGRGAAARGGRAAAPPAHREAPALS